MHWTGSRYVLFWRSGLAGVSHVTTFSKDGEILGPSHSIDLDLVEQGVAWNGSHFFVAYAHEYMLHGALLDDRGFIVKRGIAFPRNRESSQSIVKVLADGLGFVGVWSSSYARLFSESRTVFMGRFDASGNPSGDEPTIVASNPGGTVVGSTGSDLLIMWREGRTLVQWRISSDSGVPEVRPITTIGLFYEIELIWTGRYYLLVWLPIESEPGELAIYARLLDRNGKLLSDPVRLTSFGSSAPALAVNTVGDTLLIWQKSPQVFASLLRGSSLSPEQDPVLLASSSRSQDPAAIATDGRELMAVWAEYDPARKSELRAARINESGLPPEASVRISTGLRPSIAFDGTNYLAAWRDGDFIQYRRLSPAGFFVDASPESIRACGAPTLGQGSRDLLLVWDSCPRGVGREMLAVRIRDGARVDAEPISLALPETVNFNPAIAWNGEMYLVVWEEWITHWITWQISFTQRNVLGARISSAGQLLDPVPIPIAISDKEQSSPTIAWNGKHFLVLWTHVLPGQYPAKFQIRGRRISGDGSLLDGSPTDEGIEVVSESGTDRDPRLAAVGDRLFLTWLAGSWDADSDVYGALILPDSLAASSVRFQVSTTAEDELAPELVALSDEIVAVSYIRVAPGPPYGGVHRAFVRFLELPNPRFRPIRPPTTNAETN